MSGSKNTKKKISVALAAALIFQMLFVNFMIPTTASAEETPTLTLNVNNKIDVALAVAPGTSMDVSTFEQDLKTALASRGNVPADNIYVSAVEASEVSVEDNFNWWIYDHYNTNTSSTGNPAAFPTGTAYPTPYINHTTHQYIEGYLENSGNFNLRRHIVTEDGGTTMTMNGYGAPAYKDFMYMENIEATKKTFEFKVQEISAYDALDGGGFFFNTRISGTYGDAGNPQKMSGYLLFLQYNTSGKGSGISLYKFENINTSDFHHQPLSTLIDSYPGFTRLASSSNYSSTDTWRKIKIEAYPNKLKMWYLGSTSEYNEPLTDSNLVTWTVEPAFGGGTAAEVTLPSYDGTKSYGFGPMISYRSHGCSQLTQFKFKDLSMSTDAVKSLTEVIRQPEWHDGTQKFIINLNEGIIEDFNDDQKVSEIISRMSSDDIYYVGWGTDVNEAQSLEFLQKHSLKGTFININAGDTNTYQGQIDAVADHILTRYNKDVGDEDAYVLTSDNVIFSAANASLSNTADADWPEGRWLVEHDVTGFDNQQGEYAYDGNLISDLDLTFVKPGKYDIYFENSKIKTVYAHEKPIALFDITYNSGDGTVSYVDNSYDPDRKDQPGAGIAESAWKYLNVTDGDTSWTAEQLTTAAPNKNYIIALKVKDEYGEWSNEYSKQLYTGAVALKPVADFEISSGEILKGIGNESIDITDKSYNPSGDAISEWEWKVTLGGVTVYGPSAVPRTDFSTAQAGKYRIDLRVRSGSEWSEIISRFLTVVVDDLDPAVVVNPANSNVTALEPVQVTLNYSDAGGSYLKRQRYALANDTTAPSEGWSTDSSNLTRNIALNDVGTWYIHYFAEDNAGNQLTGYAGPYTITAVVPQVTTSDEVYEVTAFSATIAGNVTNDGGAVVTERGFEVTDQGEFNVTDILGEGTGAFSYTRTGLTPNTGYTYRAYAVNSEGTGCGSSQSFRTLAAVPELTGIDSFQANGDVVLNLDRNSNPSGTEFYVAKAADADFTEGTGTALDWGTHGDTSTLTIPKSAMDPGVTYYFRVKARNADNAETAYGSQTVAAMRISDPPAEPAVIPDSDTQMTVSWLAATGADGYDIYENDVRVADAITDTNITRTGLTPNSSYKYEIVSKNDSGDSVKSTPVTEYTLATVPDIDSISALPNGDITIVVEEYSNSDMTQYYVQKAENASFSGVVEAKTWTNPGDDHLITITGLNKGTKYYFRIKAKNEQGTETGYGTVLGSIGTIPADVAPAPTVTAVSASQINVSWNAAPGALSYDIYRNGAFLKNVTGTSTTDLGLAANTGYQYKIKGKNNSGMSENFSPEPAVKYTWTHVPDVVPEPQSSGTEIKVTVDTNNNSAGTQYYIEYSSSENFSEALSSTWSAATERTITDLTGGTTYYFRVKARNGNNGENTDQESVWSAAASSTTALTAAIPSATPISDTTVLITWNEVNNADSYRIYRDGSYIGSSTTGSYTDTGLKANREYSYNVTAVNIAGIESIQSDAAAARTHAAYPDSVSPAAKTVNSITFLIEPSTNSGDPAAYQLIMKQKSNGSIYKTSAWSTELSYTIDGLDNTTEYELWVGVRNSAVPGHTREAVRVIDSVYANRLPQAEFSYSDAETEYYYSENDAFNQFTITGKVYDADGQGITVTATADGLVRTQVIQSAPTAEPADDNFTLSWDIYSLSQGIYDDITISVNDIYDGAIEVPYGRTLIVDKTPPVIKFGDEIQGNHAIYVPLNGTYTPPAGVTAEDPEMEPGTPGSGAVGEAAVEGTVNTAVTGTYTITYTALDQVGNSHSITRTVHVYGAAAVAAATVSNIAQSSATLTSSVISLGAGDIADKKYGFVYGRTAGPEIGADGIINRELSNPALGSYSEDITGLSASTTYYVRSYIKVGDDVTYGAETPFKTKSAGLLSREEREAIKDIIAGMPDGAEKDALMQQLEDASPTTEDYQQMIADITVITGVREVITDIQGNDFISDADKEALFNQLLDKVQTTPGIELETADDIDMLKEIITSFDAADRQAAYEQLVDKAVADFTQDGRDLSQAEREAILGVVAEFPDETKQDEFTEKIPQLKDKEAFAGEIAAVITIDDARRIAEGIENSTLDESDKKELFRLLADQILNPDNNIDLETADDVTLFESVITGSDKEAAVKQSALEDLAGKALADLQDESGKITPAEQTTIETLISSLTDPDIGKELNAELLELAVNSVSTMEEARALAVSIMENTDLTPEDQAELLAGLADKVLAEGSGIDLETAADVALFEEVVQNSGKSDEEKQAAYEKLVDKAIADLSEAGELELSQEERGAILGVIDEVTDTDKKNELLADIPQKDKAGLASEIDIITTIEDARRAAENIANSTLGEEDKKELLGQLADKVLGTPEIRVETAGDVSMLQNAITNSDKPAADQQLAMESLVSKALADLQDEAGQITAAEQTAIDTLIGGITDPDVRKALNADLLEAAVNSVSTIEEARALADKITGNPDLTPEDEADLMAGLADQVLAEESGIQPETVADLTLFMDAVQNSNKSEEEKQAAYEDLAAKAISGFGEDGIPTAEELDAIQGVIALITDETALDALAVQLEAASKTQAYLEAQIQELDQMADPVMADVITILEDIGDSAVDEAEKAALRGELIDFVLDPDNDVAITSVEQYEQLMAAIENSDKTEEEKIAAQNQLLQKRITDLAAPVSEEARFAIAQSGYSVNENAGTIIVTVNRSVVTTGEMTIDYTTEDGTAMAGTNFTGTAGSLTFADSETGKTISIEILDAGILSDKTFKVRLANASNDAIITRGEATITVRSAALPPAPSTGKQITTFSLAGVDGTITHNAEEADGTITVTVPYGTNLNNIKPASLEYSANAVITPGTTVRRDFRNPVIYTVTAEDGSRKRYLVTVAIAPASTEAELADLIIKNGDDTIAYTPSFSGTHYFYDMDVVSSVYGITVTPTAAGPNAVIKVNGITESSGTESKTITLNSGSNEVSIVVIAEDGITNKTYLVTVIREEGEDEGEGENANTNLADLSVSTGDSLEKVSDHYYTLKTANEVTDLSVTAAAELSSSVVKINGRPLGTDDSSVTEEVSLEQGLNVITITVTSSGGSTSTYLLAVTRQSLATPSDADIAANTLKDTVTVRNVPAGATVEVYDAAGDILLGEKTNSAAGLASVTIPIPDGLDTEDSILVIITNPAGEEVSKSVFPAEGGSCSVIYDGNGRTAGSVPTDNDTYIEGSSAIIAGNTGGLVKTGYTFAGWNTAADGSGTDYDAGSNLTIGAADVILYAKWNNPTYAILYNGNGNTGGTVPNDSSSYEAGDTVTVPGNSGNLVKTGYTFAGWNTQADGRGTDYTAETAFTMGAGNLILYAKWNAKSSGGGGSSVPTPSSGDETATAIIVNGETKDNAAELETETSSTGQTVATFTINEEQLKMILEGLPLAEDVNSTGTPAERPIIQIPAAKGADVVNGQLNGQMVKDMEKKAVVLEIRTETAAYNLPAEEINIDAVSQLVGEKVKLSDIKVQIEIAKASDAKMKFVEDSAAKGNFNLVVLPVEFNITCTYGDRKAAVSRFNSYVARSIAIPDGVDPAKITTGVIVDPDGTVRHVPTKVTVINGKYYAQINSLTNSTYSVIWNPREFTDAENHWAMKAINDMGSRMIISGVGNDMFEPGRDITRAEYAAIMVRALGLQPGTDKDTFSDVRAADWYCGYVETAYEYGIISGYGNGKFGPNDRITREQVMAMTARAMKITGLNVELSEGELDKSLAAFTDSGSAADYARAGIAACVKTGIVSGKGNNLVSPKDNITRAEVAVIVRGLLQKSELI